MQFAVQGLPARLNVGDVEEVLVGPAGESNPDRLAHGGMRPIAAALRPATQRFAAFTFRPHSTTRSAMPSWAYSSSVRACTASARDVVPGSDVLSMTLTGTPSPRQPQGQH
jgi:hypothetical protein